MSDKIPLKQVNPRGKRVHSHTCLLRVTFHEIAGWKLPIFPELSSTLSDWNRVQNRVVIYVEIHFVLTVLKCLPGL